MRDAFYDHDLPLPYRGGLATLGVVAVVSAAAVGFFVTTALERLFRKPVPR